MTDLHNRKELKTRKEHKCEGCFEKIPKGTVATNCKGKWQGEFYDYHMCKPCIVYIDKYMDDISDTGFIPGEIGDYRRDGGSTE